MNINVLKQVLYLCFWKLYELKQYEFIADMQTYLGDYADQFSYLETLKIGTIDVNGTRTTYIP